MGAGGSWRLGSMSSCKWEKFLPKKSSCSPSASWTSGQPALLGGGCHCGRRSGWLIHSADCRAPSVSSHGDALWAHENPEPWPKTPQDLTPAAREDEYYAGQDKNPPPRMSHLGTGPCKCQPLPSSLHLGRGAQRSEVCLVGEWQTVEPSDLCSHSPSATC